MIRIRRIGFAALLLVCATSSRAQETVRVSCLPAKALASPGDVVSVNVWVASDAGAAIRDVNVQWKVTAGRIDGQTAETNWRLEGVEIDRRQTATVDVSIGGRPAGSCSFDVWVAPAPKDDVRVRGEYITRRAFLHAGQAGEAGYGLYSFFLMREPASAADASRAASFVGAFLDVITAIGDLDTYIERRRLNGSYLPVTSDPPAGLSAQQRNAWALDHYDYEEAKRLLSLYPTLAGSGPFIVAVPAPLRGQVKPMLPWDFSQFDAMSIADGVNRFLNQAAQLYEWQNQSTLDKLRDQLWTIVAGMFVGRASAQNLLQVVR